MNLNIRKLKKKDLINHCYDLRRDNLELKRILKRLSSVIKGYKQKNRSWSNLKY